MEGIGLGMKLKDNRRVEVLIKEEEGVIIRFKKLVDKDYLKKNKHPPENHLFLMIKNIAITEIKLTTEAAEALHELLEDLLYNQKETK